MRKALQRPQIEAAFLAACHAELRALKPGNVHIHSAGHGMEVATFEAAAAAAAPYIADPALTVGQRIFRATQASVAATGLNANLGIVLLCAPLAKAANEVSHDIGLRRRLATILSELTVSDADEAFAAIALANPAGLGKVEEGDVSANTTRLTLVQAMHLAHERDRIALAYVTAFADIFDLALPAYVDALERTGADELATTQLHMTLLAAVPDSHIARKWGAQTAARVQAMAQDRRLLWSPVVTPKSLHGLVEFDAALKADGLNPGTTADFVVATLFTRNLIKASRN